MISNISDIINNIRHPGPARDKTTSSPLPIKPTKTTDVSTIVIDAACSSFLNKFYESNGIDLELPQDELQQAKYNLLLAAVKIPNWDYTNGPPEFYHLEEQLLQSNGYKV
jgi:hypothetical protein